MIGIVDRTKYFLGHLLLHFQVQQAFSAILQNAPPNETGLLADRARGYRLGRRLASRGDRATDYSI
jgi:hypothetical protein